MASVFIQQHQSSSSTVFIQHRLHPALVFVKQHPYFSSGSPSSYHGTHPTAILRERSLFSTHTTKAQYLTGHDDKIASTYLQTTAPTQQRASDEATPSNAPANAVTLHPSPPNSKSLRSQTLDPTALHGYPPTARMLHTQPYLQATTHISRPYHEHRFRHDDFTAGHQASATAD